MIFLKIVCAFCFLTTYAISEGAHFWNALVDLRQTKRVSFDLVCILHHLDWAEKSVPLNRNTLLDLCILFEAIRVYIFIPLIHSFSFLRSFLMYITMRNMFLTRSYPWWNCWSAKARNLVFNFNFSSQRPHLNYVLLSNVCGFDFHKI